MEFDNSVERVLVVCTRRIGDVFLAYPVFSFIKDWYPNVVIDVLVFEGTEGILLHADNVNEVITVKPKMRLKEHIGFLAKLWNKYQLAISLLPGDRPTIYAWVAGENRIGTLDTSDKKNMWKCLLLNKWEKFDNKWTHTVRMNLSVAKQLVQHNPSSLKIDFLKTKNRKSDAVLPEIDGAKFVVLHVYPAFSYKRLSPDCWKVVATKLDKKGYKLILVGGDTQSEIEYVKMLRKDMPSGTIDLCGKIDFSELWQLLNRATLYIGTDTVVTHMAAARGTPTVAIFGPSNPVKWGPWPRDLALGEFLSPWELRGSQTNRNVFLLQGIGSCVPCFGEGCDRHINSESECLTQMNPDRILGAADALIKKVKNV